MVDTESPPPPLTRHEIVGEVVRVGKDVKDPEIQVGRRVGIGAQVASCYDCKHCKNDNENYCMNLVHTYVSALPLFVTLELKSVG